jgi:hypothetical protein
LLRQGLETQVGGLTLTELDEEGRPEEAGPSGSGAAAAAACKDPSGRRVGVPPPAPAARTLRQACDDAAAAINKARARAQRGAAHPLHARTRSTHASPQTHAQKQVEAKVPLTAALVAEHTRYVAAAVTICYPGGLPAWDSLGAALTGDEAALASAGPAADASLPLAGASLWGPGGKQLPPGRLLSDAVGRNEKTRALLRLQAAGEGPPGREAPVSAAEQAAMLAFYRKKQEEAARLAAAEEADSDSAAWADTRSLKAHFSGVGGVRLGGRGASGFNQGVM